jgi:hypothetical protein
MHRYYPKYSIFVDTHGAHTKLGTVIYFFYSSLVTSVVHTVIPVGELLGTNQQGDLRVL